jgi:hypothetical protein
MNEPRSSLNPDRLFEASEAVLTAMGQLAGRTTGAVPHLVALAGTPASPKALRGFSYDEVIEATLFLSRLGYLEMSRQR